ncbi:hypothetical protein AB8S08_06160 [Pseudidiomarina sp. PP-1MA]|uniref:Uncharacterized protein n=1 Tax=Pseudidiomarina sp. PP-1MA TaxID=3237706 RepID=A0AB39XC21_9GAMM
MPVPFCACNSQYIDAKYTLLHSVTNGGESMGNAYKADIEAFDALRYLFKQLTASNHANSASARHRAPHDLNNE